MKPQAFKWGWQPVQAKQPKVMQSLILLRTDFIAQHLHAMFATPWLASHIALAKAGADGLDTCAAPKDGSCLKSQAPQNVMSHALSYTKNRINHAKLLSSSWNFTHQVFVMMGCETMNRKQL